MGVIFAPVASTVREIRDELIANADSMRKLLEDSAVELEFAATAYQEQDEATAGGLANTEVAGP